MQLSKLSAAILATLIALAAVGLYRSRSRGPTTGSADPQSVTEFMCAHVRDDLQLRSDPTAARYELFGNEHLVHDIPAKNDDETINVVVEIPSGCSDKWEVNHDTGRLTWDVKNGKPRFIQYLPYVGNYGMIPQTILPTQLGGDGDPLDVLLLGPTQARGSVVQARLIGIMLATDSGERDDKLIAVATKSGPSNPFSEAKSIRAIEESGILAIIQTWFLNYKGPRVMKTRGFEDADRASEVLEAAIKAYRSKRN